MANFEIVVEENPYSHLWHWRIYAGGDYKQPIIASNGYIDEAECRTNLELVRQAFFQGVT